MLKKLARLQTVGANRQEFITSVKVVAAGFPIMYLFAPIPVAMARAPYHNMLEAVVYAGWIVFAIAGLFCALNAYRDTATDDTEKHIIIAWSLALLLWMGFLMYQLMLWSIKINEQATRG